MAIQSDLHCIIFCCIQINHLLMSAISAWSIGGMVDAKLLVCGGYTRCEWLDLMYNQHVSE